MSFSLIKFQIFIYRCFGKGQWRGDYDELKVNIGCFFSPFYLVKVSQVKDHCEERNLITMIIIQSYIDHPLHSI